MSIFAFLFERAEALEERSIRPGVIRKNAVPFPPDDDDSTDLTYGDAEQAAQIDLDHVGCIIDYCGADGDQTRRRIIPLKLLAGPHAPVMTARCLERRAIRHFRTDRIECFITYDGEVIEVDEFFHSAFCIDLDSAFEHLKEGQSPIDRARRVRDFLRPPLSILVLAARSDDEFHPEELEAICLFVERAALQAYELGKIDFLPTPEELDLVTGMVRKMTPASNSLKGYLETIMSYRAERQELFAKTLVDVIRADGHVRLSEELFLNDIELLRKRVINSFWPDKLDDGMTG